MGGTEESQRDEAGTDATTEVARRAADAVRSGALPAPSRTVAADDDAPACSCHGCHAA